MEGVNTEKSALKQNWSNTEAAKEINKLFKFFDSDGDGVITTAEFRSGMKK
jgi:Ca2+-binding EF-hand superfamily protein